MPNPLIVALDTADRERLADLAAAVAPSVCGLKVGLQAYSALGAEAVRLAGAHAPVFCDLKLHDIPNTVAAAAAVVADLGVELLTVHATGGPAMISAAASAAPDVNILAVTVLTSLDDATLAALGQPPAGEQVPRLSRMAVEAGAAGIVCSAGDVRAVRAAVGDGVLIVVPGIRPAGTGRHDQARVATPRAALDAGADKLVVGRAVTAAPDPAEAARALRAEVGG